MSGRSREPDARARLLIVVIVVVEKYVRPRIFARSSRAATDGKKERERAREKEGGKARPSAIFSTLYCTRELKLKTIDGVLPSDMPWAPFYVRYTRICNFAKIIAKVRHARARGAIRGDPQIARFRAPLERVLGKLPAPYEMATISSTTMLENRYYSRPAYVFESTNCDTD